MQIIGHRGCRGLFPENTLTSFKEAIKIGVHAIEFDVVVSADSKIVVSHEPFMSQITCLKPNGREITDAEDRLYNLFEMSYQEVKQFNCGLNYHPKFPKQQLASAYKPLLTETIEVCETYANSLGNPLDYIIEIKSKPELYDVFYPQPKVYVKLLLEELKSFSFQERIILKSFDVNILNEIKKQNPLQKMSLLINRTESIADKLKLLTFTPEILGPYFELLDQETVGYYQEKGFQVFPWTINELSDMKRLIDFGVDGIITDYPDRLVC